jgi:hypothetical protein
VIADNTLLTAFAAGRRPATASMVLEVCRDFDLGAVKDGVPEKPGVGAAVSALTPGNGLGAPRPAHAPVGLSPFGSLFGTPRPRRRRFSFFS